MITQIREDPMKGMSRPPSEFAFRPTSYSQPFSIPYINPFTSRPEDKSRPPKSLALKMPPSAISASSSFTSHIETQPYVLPSEPSPAHSPSYASSETFGSFSSRTQTHALIHSPFPSYPSYPSPYPSYPPSRSPSTFHIRSHHSRNPSASSLSSFCSNSSVSSSRTMPRSKPNTLTKDYLFHLRFQRSAFARQQPVMMDEDDEWEEWGRGMRGVLEPRIVGPGWGDWVAPGVEEVLNGGW
ncbi:hypothetical protein MMC07_007391 [Pseudocyphellaria aurata]|nr:hypothetical protein [Pseudocyphellaria aurata]